jgi:hypothetical protein
MSLFSVLCRRIGVLCVMAAVKQVLCDIIWPSMGALFKLSDTLYFCNCIEICGFSISCMFLFHGCVTVFQVIELRSLVVMNSEIF